MTVLAESTAEVVDDGLAKHNALVLVAVTCGLASYAMMNLLMTSAPLAMVMCNHSVGEAALGIQWHMIGM
jgi:hypothetical protein